MSIAEVETAQPTLDELAATANAEHRLVGMALGAALSHAIAAGEALISAEHVLLGTGLSRKEWFDATGIPRSTSASYMRLATFKDHIPSGVSSANKALSFLRSVGLERPRTGRRDHRIPDEVRAEAKRLRDEGLNQYEAAEVLGISQTAVRAATEPGAREAIRATHRRYRERQRAATAALRQKEKADLAKKAGGNVSEAYSLVRKALLELDAALADATEPDYKAALRQALAAAHKTEDHIVAALKASRTR